MHAEQLPGSVSALKDRQNRLGATMDGQSLSQCFWPAGLISAVDILRNPFLCVQFGCLSPESVLVH